MSTIDHLVLGTIIDTAHDHFFVVTADGTIDYVSPSAAAVYGISCEELRASNVQRLEVDGVLNPSISMEVMRTGQPAQLIQRTATGRRVIAQAHPVFENGKLVAVVSRSMDLTDLQLLQQEYAFLQQRFSEHLKRSQEHEQGDLSLESELSELQIKSPLMREIALLLKRVAPTDATVMMLGESGVGKTAFARQLHHWSARNAGAFVDVNCAAIPESLFEAEMFGYRSGAFSGAAPGGRVGLIEQAAGGTLFLDEIGELPLAMQTKLLKAIQDGRIARLGENLSRQVDFRLVVATNRNLMKRVEEGTFRLDLYYRLNVIPVTLPPLRERREDIPELVNRQLERLNRRYGQEKLLARTVWRPLMRHEWPGNVRELENWLERAWLSCNDVIHADVPGLTHAGTAEPQAPNHAEHPSKATDVSTIGVGEGLKDATNRIERSILAELCEALPSTYAIAKRLDISQPSVVRKLKHHQLRVKNTT
ncbi:sigma-54 interaction domain-containing protein [Halomonas llamarensis]|uniref:HTH-type transcriptional regulatory protein TyrR n=1 Tax=Halomonas llamarensis TaxID=2945104 RepID=A0ABT0ST22_9GAMM|nr:sigma 54-interacting transcriptional regulator [Halomonas llamarensis]MCL7930984.1 sigma 54-interacting transcriptional regulator [Halomonas llamarensis]